MHACLAELWERAEARGVTVGYAPTNEKCGWTDGRYLSAKPKLAQGARIKIYRDPPPESPWDASDPCADVITLSHECGHCISDHSGRFTQDYQIARDRLNGLKTLTCAQGRLILLEERRAWRTARRVLKCLKFEEWPRFHTARRTSLESYENGILDLCHQSDLGLPD